MLYQHHTRPSSAMIALLLNSFFTENSGSPSAERGRDRKLEVPKFEPDAGCWDHLARISPHLWWQEVLVITHQDVYVAAECSASQGHYIAKRMVGAQLPRSTFVERM